MKFNVISIFPNLVQQAMSYGIVGRAMERKLVELTLVNPRQFTCDVHQTIDDRPFGGGDGMLMQAEPLKESIEFLGKKKGFVVALSPHGKKWCDSMARSWVVNYKEITWVCGRYGGMDQRFIERYVDEEISLGDFVLSGGEVASLALMDSLIRQLPGVLGNEVSCKAESFYEGLLEAPQFTRPRKWEGEVVPEVLLSGNHKEIQSWRSHLALVKTNQLRPDLLQTHQRKLLAKAKKEALKMSDCELSSCGLKRLELEN